MKASEILRKLADVVSAAEAGEQSPEHGPQNVDNVKLAPVDVDHSDDSESPLFVPPLQAKIELLKKAVDVDSVYDDEGDELSQMKKMAGINPVVADEAGGDEPFDG
jgi:hypothetical protein